MTDEERKQFRRDAALAALPAVIARSQLQYSLISIMTDVIEDTMEVAERLLLSIEMTEEGEEM